MCGSLEGQVTTKGNSEWAGSEGTPKHETSAHPGTMCMCVYASVYSMHPNTSILAWECWGLGKAYTEHGLCPACHWSHWWLGCEPVLVVLPSEVLQAQVADVLGSILCGFLFWFSFHFLSLTAISSPLPPLFCQRLFFFSSIGDLFCSLACQV